MHLGTDVVGNQPDDTFTVAGRQAFARIDHTAGQTIDPKPPIWIEHHFDDGSVIEPPRDRWAKCGAQHAGAARGCLVVEMVDSHLRPQTSLTSWLTAKLQS